MKTRLITLLLTLLTLTPMTLFAQSYASLWKQVERSQEADLPQQTLQTLRRIVDKATRGRDYGQLLKAQLLELQVQTDVSPDSLQPAVERLAATVETTTDSVLRAVRCAVLAIVYRDNAQLDDHADRLSLQYFDQALQSPSLLAATRASGYRPLVVTGADSRVYDDDLLSLIGREAGRYELLHRYYLTTPNRRAQLFSALDLLRQERDDSRPREALNKSGYLHRLDSLIERYGDLTECGEAAIERADYMASNTDATPEQQWQYVAQALDRWGGWKRMNELRDRQRTLSALQYNAELPTSVVLPGRAIDVPLTQLRGVRTLTMSVSRVAVQGDTELDPVRSGDYNRLRPLLTPLPELGQTRTYVGRQPYELWTDTLTLAPLPAGVYLVEFSSEPATMTSRRLLFVSDVRVMVLPLPGEQTTRLVAVNATTGQPLPGATITLIDRERRRQRNGSYAYERTTTVLHANARGEAVSRQLDYGTRVWGTTADDSYCPPQAGLAERYRNPGVRPQAQRYDLFTDRAIYRPGQTVHAAVVAYTTRQGYVNQADSGQAVRLRLLDANHEEVAVQELTTDAYGTSAADFVLPSRGLTGSFCLMANGNSHYFRVEEYKRPTFELRFPTVNQSYADGDTVVVRPTAVTYAGVPVQGARVTWTVVRRRAFWWGFYSRYWQQGYIGTADEEETLATGEGVTAADGTFEAELPMVVPPTRYAMFYNFVLRAQVTDQGGETHEGELSLPLGNRRTALSIDVAEKVVADAQPTFTLHLYNAAGIDINATVRYQIDGGPWQEAATATALPLPALASGRHTLRAQDPSAAADEPAERTFVVFSLGDERAPVETDDWFYLSHTQFPTDGTPVTLQVGTSAPDAYLVYALFSGGRQIESGAVERSDQLVNRRFTYADSLDNGLLLTYAWMRDGHMYSHTATIRRPLPDRRLRLEWHTFRDRLTPGQQEQWTLRVLMPDGTPAPAQLMATLYDKSLDQLSPHALSLTPPCYVALPYSAWQTARWSRLSFYGQKRQDYLETPDLVFSHFDSDIFPTRYGRHVLLGAAGGGILYQRATRSMRTMATADNMAMADLDMVEAAAPQMKEAAMALEEEADDAGGQPQDAGTTAVQLRQNLQETAFFMPQLVADATGTVTLRFTLPESLTTWRFLGLAHTTDMMVGTLDGEAVASKEMMVMPNVPRFVRLGDRATIAARVVNSGDHDRDVVARLELADPETQAVVASSRQRLTVGAGTTAAVTFDCRPETAWPSLLVVRVSIEGEGFSDGEQQYLPVLPDTETVTVSVPITQNGPGTATVDLTALVPAGLPAAPLAPQLTVEYTNNPAWLLIQTLPTVAHPHDGCATCQAVALYANALGRHILSQNTAASDIFEAWSRETGDETSLISNLQKNEQLRQLLLDETPWVADARSEADQKRRLADFFDQTLMDQRITQAVQQLAALQQGDGAWSWWPGLPGSFYMTTTVTELLVRLDAMTGGSQAETQAMVTRAFDYLGAQVCETVDRMKKAEREGHPQAFPSHKVLEWLYICAIDGRQLPRKVQQTNDYLIRLLRKEKLNQSIYDKALTAIVLRDATYVESLKQYTVCRDDIGRYYDTPRALYSWRDYRIPTQVMAIEAMQRLTPQDSTTIQEMQRWLLNQKRTQAWDTPVNTADAVYAFLHGNRQALEPQTATRLTIDREPLPTSQATAGVGYVKTTVPYSGQRQFAAEKTSAGTSWGAVYAQFVQPAADIAAQQSGMSVRRELLVADATGQLVPLTGAVAVGTRLTVRLTVEADRDYDFVQLQDKRAACLEPAQQLSGYQWRWGCYCAPRDNATCYYFDQLSKGRHVIETAYYVDRAGTYDTGTCTAECAYAPEFRAKAPAVTITVAER